MAPHSSLSPDSSQVPDSPPSTIFDDQALTANRRGTITDEQLKQIQWPIRFHLILQWVLLLVLCAVGAYFVMLLTLTPDVWMILISIALVFISLMGWLTQSRLGSLKQREVASVAGPVSRKIIFSGKKPRHEIVVARKKFRVPAEIYNSMEEDAYYRIYYQPKIKVLLTAEEV